MPDSLLPPLTPSPNTVQEQASSNSAATDSPPQSHDKPCTLCNTPRSVLVRCQIDQTQKWHFVCPGKCWKEVSGGVEDAKGFEGKYEWYRYGGMWKNKHTDGKKMSAKKPKRVKERQKKERKQRDQLEGQEGADISASESSDGKVMNAKKPKRVKERQKKDREERDQLESHDGEADGASGSSDGDGNGEEAEAELRHLD